VWSDYGMLLTGESVECLRNGTDRGSVEFLRNGTDRGKCGVFTESYRQGKLWSVYGMVLTVESVECLRNGTDRGKCGVFKEWY